MKRLYTLPAVTYLFLTSLTMSAQSPVVRLEMKALNFNDETVFYFQQGGTTSFQSDMDAYKLIPNQGQYPYLGGLSADSVLTSINGLPALPVNLQMAVKAISPSNKTFTFSTETTDFPDNVCVTLYDAFTGVTTNILTSDYVCTLYDSTSCARFKMNFFTTSTEGISSLKQPGCGLQNQGLITAAGVGSGPWNFEWRNGDSIVKTCNNKMTCDSLSNLSNGVYSVRVSQPGQCSAFSRTFEIIPVATPKSNFSADSYTTTLSELGKISFTNTSINNQFNIWDFGDNSGTWYIPSPSHNYDKPGSYTVTLITESINHCKDTSSQVVTVIDDVTGISKNTMNREILLATMAPGNYELRFQLSQSTDMQVQLCDMKGTVLQKNTLQNTSSTIQFIDLSAYTSGIYFLSVISKEGIQKTYKLTN